MKHYIESRIVGTDVMFRMRCCSCGRIGIYHRDLNIAELVAELHGKYAHGREE